MIDKKNPSHEVHAKFLKTVLARCVDLGWDDDTLCDKALVLRPTWKKIRRFEASPGLREVVKICSAIGLEVQYDIKRKHTSG